MKSQIICITLALVFSMALAGPAGVIHTKNIQNCGGSQDYAFLFTEGTIPDIIYLPGTFPLNMGVRLSKQMPDDLMIKLKLKKLDPFPMDVPCLDGLGSCPYSMCDTIANLADTLCPSFPASQPCSCPLLAGDLNIQGAEIPVPDFGPILGALMTGNYDATATVYGDSNPDEILGCIEMSFRFESA